MNSKQEKGETKTIKSVIKAFDVINCLVLSDKEMGVTEISRELNFGVSATYHLLNTLLECRIIEQNEETKKFRLGLKLWQIGMVSFEKNNISNLLTSYLHKLKEDTGETANLAVLNNNEIVYVGQVESNNLLKIFTRVGTSAPLHCTGSGKVLLANLPLPKLEVILNSIDLHKYTPNTITSKEDLLGQLEKIKKQGYAIDNEERELGICCISAPIFGPNNHILSSISISGPKTRFTEENMKKWTQIVIDISRESTDYVKSIT